MSVVIQQSVQFKINFFKCFLFDYKWYRDKTFSKKLIDFKVMNDFR